MFSSDKSGIVISGISGRYPESLNLQEFWDKLLAGQELSSIDDRRWPVGLHDLPMRSGKVPQAEKFDASFFEIPEQQANFMDPQIRIFHETTFEAIVDAGYDPNDLKGSRTAVYIGWCYNDTDSAMKEDESKVAEYLQLASNRLSLSFGFKGTSLGVDTACASSLTAFHQAVTALKAGECDTAIVGGWAIHARPSLAVCFHQLGMIATDGRSKCMDASADGYCRSEAVVAVLLQRKSVARRIYANVLNTRTNTDGFKVEGITFPSMTAQRKLMEETYADIGMEPREIDYVEAHMTGTAAGDPVESAAIAGILCKDRVGGLPIGCLKSNMGHSEGASGVCAITKSCLILQRKEIPPNIFFNKPNPNIEALKTGAFLPVTKRQAFDGKTIALNCFGFGGCNVHVVIDGNEKSVTDDSFRITSHPFDRLVQICGRTRDSLNSMREYMRNNKKLTREWLALVDQTAYIDPNRGMNFRSFVIMNEGREFIVTREAMVRDRRPVVLFFPGHLSSHFTISPALLQLEPVKEALHLVQSVLPADVNVQSILHHSSAKVGDTIFKMALSQILVSHLLKKLGVEIESVIGNSFGNVAAAHASGFLTLEESARAALLFAAAASSGKSIMTRVTGITEDILKRHLPANSQILYKESFTSFIVMTDGSENGSTLSAAATAGATRQTLVSYEFGQSIIQMNREMRKIFPDRKQRPSTWLAADGKINVMNASDIVQSVLSPSNSCPLFDFIDKNAVTVEVGPESMMESSLKQGLGPDISYINFNISDIMTETSLLETIGDLYLNGVDPRASRLYPAVSFPVPQEVDSISPLLKWNHDRDWMFFKMPDYFDYVKSNQPFVFDLMEPRYQYLAGHCVDGRILLPATGYLWIVWDIFAHLMGFKGEAGRAFLSAPVEFTDIEFNRATILSKSSGVTVNVLILISTGKFLITEGGTTCVSGYIRIPPESAYSTSHLEDMVQCRVDDDAVTLTSADIYKEMRVRGYDYGPSFQNLVEASSDGSMGKVKWNGNWVSFTDSLLQLAIVGHKKRELCLPTSIQFLKCDIKALMREVENNENKIIDVHFDKVANTGRCRGLILKGLTASPVTRRVNQQPMIESYNFTPYDEDVTTPDSLIKSVQQYAHVCDKYTSALMLGTQVDTDIEASAKTFGSQDQSLLKALRSGTQKEAPMSTDDLQKALRNSEENLLIRASIDNERLTRVPIDIVLENSPIKLDVVEINFRDTKFFDILSNLATLSNIAINYSVVSSETDPVLPAKVNQLKSGLPAESKANLIIINDPTSSVLFKNTAEFDSMESLQSCYSSLEEGAFVLMFARDQVHPFERQLCSHLQQSPPMLQDKHNILNVATAAGFVAVSVRRDSLGFLAILLRKPVTQFMTNFSSIAVDTNDYSWVEELKACMAKKEKHPIWLTGTDSQANGLIGMMTCLRKEEGGKRLRCVFAPPSPKGPVIDNNNILTKELLQKDLTVNVIQDGEFGSYRYKVEKSLDKVAEVSESFLDVQTKGDLSSLRFYQSRMRKMNHTYSVHYAALNFKDVMIASGRIPPNAYPSDGYEDYKGNLGMEFSGIDSRGRKVMGLVPMNAIATTVSVDDNSLIWEIPNHWTLEQAATVPVVYFTSYYALIIRGRMTAGDSVLIHAGSGGVGQAAISICLSMGCEVFTTVGSQEKRQFIRKTFPSIEEDHILNSRDLTFEEHILRMTDGRGVEIVLNSLAEDKMQASMRCLADFGRFLEIGKYDIMQNRAFPANQFMDNKTFHAICVAHLVHDTTISKSPSAIQMTQMIKKLMMDGIAKGEVRPIRADVFDRHRTEEAFRFMATGKHMGKVLIRMKDSGNEEKMLTVRSIIRTNFDANKSYIVTGGLGGFGLELAQWMVNSGARKLLLTSRSGLKTAYQRLAVKRMQRQAQVIISSADLLTEESTRSLLTEAQSLGPVGGIFHLAMVLGDALFENQSAEKFRDVCGSKVQGTIHLDKLSRESCKELDHFVCFSSVAAGRGNPGQANYGFANSSMERICEARKRDGLPGIAIQWGAVGDVGVVAEVMGGNDVVIGGSVPQRIPSCLDVLDKILNLDIPVLSSIVPADMKRSLGDGSEDLLKVVCHVLGVKDPENLSDDTTLGDLGMDSLMAVEIRQGLERDYDVIMSATEVRQLRIRQIREMSDKRKNKSPGAAGGESNSNPHSGFQFQPASDPFRKLNSSSTGKVILFFPSLDANFNLMANILSNVVRPVIGINWTKECDDCSCIKDLARHFAQLIRSYYPLETEFDLMGHSFGCLLALETGMQLQQMVGMEGVRRLLFIDGSVDSLSKQIDPRTATNGLQALTELVSQAVPIGYPQLEEKLSQTSDETRLLSVIDLLKQESDIDVDVETLAAAVSRHQAKTTMIHSYDNNGKQFEGSIRLIRPASCVTTFTGKSVRIADDYNITSSMTGDCSVVTVDGDSRNFLQISHSDVASQIDTFYRHIVFA